jgi:hypothetical protein
VDPKGGFVYDKNDNILQAQGTAAPADGASGYAVGALFWNLSGATGLQQLVNIGTATSCQFRPLGALQSLVAGGSALTLTAQAHGGATIQLDTAAGTTITLPALSETGTGLVFNFVITVVATSNNHKIQVANSTDTMTGMLMAVSDDAGFPVKGYTADATAGADTITLNRTTTGSTVKGEWIRVQDVGGNKWAVSGMIASTGTEATPFSAAV